MLPEIGTFSIILAFCFSLFQFTSCGNKWSAACAWNQFIFLTIAMLCLILGFLSNDMSVIYIREHSHFLMPWFYRAGAAWGGHEGSLLLWCFILSIWTIAFLIFYNRNLEKIFFTRILMILGLISCVFIGFLLWTSNPFKREFPSQFITGNNLTPILQDPGLIFHPPMLYLGYVGFVISFAFAFAALLTKKISLNWAVSLRPWIILPWAFLSCGIVLGSWWAYRELGWGGWWFWDPVENASLLPWLSATALLHSLKLVEKRNTFQGWTLLLAILTFSLSLLGTFLVRSGIVVSVHAFASDPARGLFMMIFLGTLIASAFTLYAIRIKYFYQAQTFHFFSRESFLLMNSIFLIMAVIAIMLGTLYPIVLQILNLEKITINEYYFNSVFTLLMLPMLLLMGAAPHMNWHRTQYFSLGIPALCSLIIALMLPKLFQFSYHLITELGIFSACWIICSTLAYCMKTKITLQRSAMVISHIGIAIFVLGVCFNKTYRLERQVKMHLGETVELAGYQFSLKNLTETQGPNYQSLTALFLVNYPGKKEERVTAEQRLYLQDQSVNKIGILFNSWRDLYISLGPPLPDNSWSIKIYYQPFVRWIWFGGLMLLAGALSSLFRNKRLGD